MTLGIRKIIVAVLVGGVFISGNIMLIAGWLQSRGVIDAANDIRKEFLTGTAITIVIVLLILLVGPKAHGISLTRRRCPVCDHGVPGSAKYCCECGSKL